MQKERRKKKHAHNNSSVLFLSFGMYASVKMNLRQEKRKKVKEEETMNSTDAYEMRINFQRWFVSKQPKKVISSR